MSGVTTWGGLRAAPAPTTLAAGGLALVACTAALAGCTAAAPPPLPAVTVTVSPAAPVTSVAVTPTASTAIPGGRHYDVGTIVGFATDGDLTVLTLDRWTVDGVSDATLARDGIPIMPDPGRRFRDVSAKSYPVPVAPDIVIVINTCLPSSDPLRPAGMNSRPVSLHDFLTMPDREQVIAILTYADGEAVRLETDPRC